jgi:hypothetical protein
MNETKELETQLRSWAPRRPSPKLETSLFGEKPVAAPEPALPAFRLSWLAPSGVALILICLLFNQRFNPSVQQGTGSTPVVAMISSNQSLTSSSIPFSARVLGDAFEFTNGSSLTSANIISARLIATNL